MATETQMTRYRVQYERDETGAWIVRVPRVRGCHTYGRTIEQARERLREALSLFVPNADSAIFVEDIRLPKRARTIVLRVRRERARAEAEQASALKVAAAAAQELTGTWRLSLRDAGELLGLSRQRVQQLVNGRPASSRPARQARGRA